jgi:hypothetical protein
MRVTIIKDDNKVAIDGVAYSVDCKMLPLDFHALQWDGTRGEIEFKVTRCAHCGARSKKGNETITDLSPYTKHVDAWNVAKATADAARPKN